MMLSRLVRTHHILQSLTMWRLPSPPACPSEARPTVRSPPRSSSGGGRSRASTHPPNWRAHISTHMSARARGTRPLRQQHTPPHTPCPLAAYRSRRRQPARTDTGTDMATGHLADQQRTFGLGGVRLGAAGSCFTPHGAAPHTPSGPHPHHPPRHHAPRRTRAGLRASLS
jgi:hypothetical protein